MDFRIFTITAKHKRNGNIWLIQYPKENIHMEAGELFQFLPAEEDKMEQLRKLDHSVYQKAKAWSVSPGVIGALILATGMSPCMAALSYLQERTAMFLGILVGPACMVLIALAYPLYNRTIPKKSASALRRRSFG